MLRRSLVLAVVLAVASSGVFAATAYSQWNGTLGGEWGNAASWNCNLPAGSHLVPNATDAGGVMGNPNYKAGFKTPGNYPNLSATANYGTGLVTTDILVFGGANPSNLDNLVVSGATVSVSEYVTLAAGATDVGIVRMNSGTISTGERYNNGQFYVTQLGKGTLYMNGGTINVGTAYAGNLSMTGAGTTSVGTLNLDGGTIYATDLLKGSGIASLIVKGGSLVLKTNRSTEIDGYVDDGWLKAYAGYTLQVNYDDLADTTTVSATIPEPATMSLLGLGVLGLLRRNKK